MLEIPPVLTVRRPTRRPSDAQIAAIVDSDRAIYIE